MWLDGHLITYILALLREITPLAVQIHHVWRNCHYLLPRHFIGTISKVLIGRYPQPAPPHGYSVPHDLHPLWGITLHGSDCTARWVGNEYEGFICMFCEGDAALAGVRELWLADVSPVPCAEPHMLRATVANQLRALIQAMSALETVVLVNQFQAPWTGAPPSLRLLPDAREGEGHIGPRPSTVRIAHGYGKHVLRWWTERADPVFAVAPLDLTGILEELASGAYDYIQHLTIEVPYHVPVDAGDVERLRRYCNTVQVKVVVSRRQSRFRRTVMSRLLGRRATPRGRISSGHVLRSEHCTILVVCDYHSYSSTMKCIAESPGTVL